MRTWEINRKTNETEISLKLNLDGVGQSQIQTDCGFLAHMLTLFAKHGDFDLKLTCKGDSEVDFHHTAEDIGICLGDAFAKALGDCKGICRYGDIILPMDEALMLCAVDVSGRPYLGYSVDIPAARVGDFDTELAEEFWLAFVRRAGITLHLQLLAGKNSHHIIEAEFKAVARALAKACAIDAAKADQIPSTKGVL
ncbi:MAG: imidazoleglycerol-phosphate dehydratase HisB [Clostridia bacterium]|nr:imidazoleglycerol-phosphate dehydratase HisB [Clostridia bacterium]